MKKKCIIIMLLIMAIVSCVVIINKRKVIRSNESNISAEVQKNTSADNNVSNREGEDKNPQGNNNAINGSEDSITNENKDIFSDYYYEADALLATMTLEEKVGQMFLARYPGASRASNEIKSYNPGGYILFGVDFKNKTKEQVTKEIASNQSNSKIKLLIAVDEEGGSVTRVSSYTNFRASKFKSPQVLNREGGMEAIINDSKEKSELLKSIGINMNLCPVVDIASNSSSFIYSRTYGKGAEETADYASKLIEQMNKDNMIASMKHFPGYGDNVDTHTGIAIDKRNYEIFEQSDFLPFISGIEHKCPTILVNHNIVNSMDSSMPASLSENVHKILRADLGFSGLIITDDLAMEAVKSYVTNGEAAVQAVLAGNDMIISSNFKGQSQEVINAVKSGKISEETINKAVRRILACKYYYGILN